MTIIFFCFQGIPNDEIGEHVICHECPFNSWDRKQGKLFCSFHDSNVNEKITVLNSCLITPNESISVVGKRVLTIDSYKTAFRLLVSLLDEIQRLATRVKKQ